jgi:capsular polysaccharide biosynthesis protein
MKSEEFDIFKIFLILKKRLVLIAVVFVIATSYLFYDYTFNTRPNHVANFTVYSTAIESKVLADQINNIQRLLEIKDHQSVANNLGIEYTEAKKLRAFTVKEANDSGRKMVNVNVVAKDSTLLFNLPELLRNYISENQYFRNSIDLYRQHLDYELAKVEYELDSVSSVYNYDKNTIVNNFRGLGELLDRKYKAAENIQNFTDFALIGKNNIKAGGISIKYNVVASIAGGFTFGIIAALLIEFLVFLNRRIKEYEQN